MLKLILRALVALAVIAAVGLVTPAPASAKFPTGCDTTWSSWRTTGSPTWGQWRYCSAYESLVTYYRFQVDDTLTDGYAVHIEATQYGTWSHLQWSVSPYCLQSTGNGETSTWPAWSLLPNEEIQVRLVKGTCSPHGNYGTSASWLIVAT